MANLIPQLAKKRVAGEYWLRVITAWFLLWAGALIVASVLLFPVYIFTATQVAVNEEAVQQVQETVASTDAAIAEIQRANQQARLIIEDSRKNRAYDYVSLFESLEGQGAQLTEINFIKPNDAITEVRLAGVAETREALAAFRDRLLTEETIESVDLPISNLANNSDINFTMTVTMDKKVSL